jgi:hypothetical protein
MMNNQYPHREIIWQDGSAIPAELRDMLLDGLQPGFEIEHGEFTPNADHSVAMTFRLSVLRPRQKPRTWEIRLSCPAEAATVLRPQATFAEREWFTVMIRTHISEWLNGVPSIVEAARLVK